MKLSGYYKNLKNNVELKINYNNLNQYDKVFIAKVFTDTPIPEEILKLPNVKYGGTGFFYDKAEPLPHDIEHHFPDYHLYDSWVETQVNNGSKRKEFEYYLDYSIGFTTRGCFRGCEFCVNKNSKQSAVHSPISEFLDVNRKYICLQDDNVFACSSWKSIFEDLQNTGKPFTYRQGLDERLLTEEKSIALSKSKWRGNIIFAFDNIKDKDIIIKKLKLFKKYNKKTPKFFVFSGFDRKNKWDERFWVNDIVEVFQRLEILMQYECLPYLTRFNKYEESPYRGMYINFARWCNQPNFFKKKSFREFCEANGEKSATMRYMREFEKKYPEIAKKYFDLKYPQYYI